MAKVLDFCHHKLALGKIAKELMSLKTRQHSVDVVSVFLEGVGYYDDIIKICSTDSTQQSLQDNMLAETRMVR